MKKLNTLCLLLFLSFTAQAEASLKILNGEDISFAELKGKWVLINYWAEWCHTCVQEIPEFNRFYLNNQHKNVALYAFNYDNLPKATQLQLIKKHQMLYPNLEKNPSQDLALGDIPGVPVTFVFNTTGKLVKTLYGGQSAAELELAIAP